MIPHWLWTLWFALGLGWLAMFGVLEGIALADKVSGDTLSEVVWQHLHLPPAFWFIVGGAAIGTAVWLFWLHFAPSGKWGV